MSSTKDSPMDGRPSSTDELNAAVTSTDTSNSWKTVSPTLSSESEGKVSDPDVCKEEVADEPRSIILEMLSQLKAGMDLHRITFPAFVLEPRSLLERITDFMSHQDLILE
jgi:hypothetical protein